METYRLSVPIYVPCHNFLSGLTWDREQCVAGVSDRSRGSGVGGILNGVY